MPVHWEMSIPLDRRFVRKIRKRLVTWRNFTWWNPKWPLPISTMAMDNAEAMLKFVVQHVLETLSRVICNFSEIL